MGVWHDRSSMNAWQRKADDLGWLVEGSAEHGYVVKDRSRKVILRDDAATCEALVNRVHGHHQTARELQSELTALQERYGNSEKLAGTWVGISQEGNYCLVGKNAGGDLEVRAEGNASLIRDTLNGYAQEARATRSAGVPFGSVPRNDNDGFERSRDRDQSPARTMAL